MADREHFRLQFPPESSPTLTTSDGVFPVTEISERGMRITAAPIDTWTESEVVRGKLELLSGGEIRVSGRLSRFEDDVAIVVDVVGISLQEMLAEQRYLITWFPDHLSRDEKSQEAAS